MLNIPNTTMTPAFRTVPLFVFSITTALCWVADFSTARALPQMGILGAIAVRYLVAALLKLHPSFKDPAQRLPSLLALLCAVFTYGGVLAPHWFPDARSLAYVLSAVRLAPADPARAAEVDGVLAVLGWAGLGVLGWVSFPVLFPWELRRSLERAAAPEQEAAVADKPKSE